MQKIKLIASGQLITCCLFLATSGLFCGCNRSGPAPQKALVTEDTQSPFGSALELHSPDADAGASEGVVLTQVQDAMGAGHVYRNGQKGKALLVETTGGGCGWCDFDRDGRIDLYVNQGGDPAGGSVVEQPSDDLLRNVGGRFLAVGAAARIEEREYSQGVAIADFDNDGFDDIYVTNVGRNTLWWNCGDGTFVEVAAGAGVDDPQWGASAGWGDLDMDGDLDLYVCNYCEYDPRQPKRCLDRDGLDTICNPGTLRPQPDACYMNQGDGTFEEQARSRGLLGEGNRALGVAIADFTGDMLPDIYVANDTTANFLFINQGNGRFVDEALLRGCGVNREGATQASMGLGVGDVDGNGLLDIYSTHYFEESNTLYENFGEQGFQDVTALGGLHRPTLASLAFGAVIADLDCDGKQEVFIANGHIDNSAQAPDPRMAPQLFSRAANGRWSDIGNAAGEYFQGRYMGRGVAMGDFDGDHDLDLAVIHQNDSLALLRNDSSRGSWLEVALVGVQSNRTGIGCHILIEAGANQWSQQICGGTSYAVSHEPKVVFGLGQFRGQVTCTVTWPSGVKQVVTSESNRALRLVEQ